MENGELSMDNATAKKIIENLELRLTKKIKFNFRVLSYSTIKMELFQF